MEERWWWTSEAGRRWGFPARSGHLLGSSSPSPAEEAGPSSGWAAKRPGTMFSFEGDFKTRPKVSLGGASKKVGLAKGRRDSGFSGRGEASRSPRAALRLSPLVISSSGEGGPEQAWLGDGSAELKPGKVWRSLQAAGPGASSPRFLCGAPAGKQAS